MKPVRVVNIDQSKTEKGVWDNPILRKEAGILVSDNAKES